MTIKADLDELVFENREKAYGGYVLRKMYRYYLLIAVAIVCFLVLTAAVVPPLLQKWQHAKALNEKIVFMNPELPSIEDKKEDKPKEAYTPPAPPEDLPQEAPATPPTQAFLVPDPKPETEVEPEATMLSVDSLAKVVVSTETHEGTATDNLNAVPFTEKLPHGEGTGAPAVIQEVPKAQPVAKVPEEEKIPDSKIFIPCSKQPKAVNLDDINKEIGYPAVAIEIGLEADMIFRVLIDENGNYMKHIIISKNSHPILVKAVEEHLKEIKFTPALQGQNPVKFWVNVPFKFHLLN